MRSPLRVFNLSGAQPAANADGSSATFVTLAALCRAGAEITYAFPAPDSYQEDSAFCAELSAACDGRLTLLPLSYRGDFLNTLSVLSNVAANLAAQRIWSLLLLRSRSTLGRKDLVLRAMFTTRDLTGNLARPVAATIRENRFDVAQVDFPWMAQLGLAARRLIPTVYVCYELESNMVSQSAPDSTRLRDKLRRCESNFMRKYDRVVTLTPEDKQYVTTTLGVAGVDCSPLAVDTASMVPPVPFEELAPASRFTFLGGYLHHPNVDAVTWLCQEIMPLLRARVPGARLAIIGRYPEEFVSRFSSSDIRFEGFVADLGPSLRGSILLCPVRHASGMRIKILDAVLRGAAVVSTTVGKIGLPFEPEREILLADSAEEFSRQCRRLIDDAQLRFQMTLAAQQRLESNFSPRVVAEHRLRILEGVASRGRTARRGL